MGRRERKPEVQIGGGDESSRRGSILIRRKSGKDSEKGRKGPNKTEARLGMDHRLSWWLKEEEVAGNVDQIRHQGQRGAGTLGAKKLCKGEELDPRSAMIWFDGELELAGRHE